MFVAFSLELLEYIWVNLVYQTSTARFLFYIQNFKTYPVDGSQKKRYVIKIINKRLIFLTSYFFQKLYLQNLKTDQINVTSI